MEPLISREPLRSAVRRVLIDRVLAGELRPGEPLVESELAAKLGVSRTPLREALVGLEVEGIVESSLGKGFSVVPLTTCEARDLYAIVGTLEAVGLREIPAAPDAARVARLQRLDRTRLDALADPGKRIDLDTRWHEELLGPCPNRALLRVLSQLRGQLYRYEHAFQQDRPRVEAAVGQHEEVLATLCRGDRTRAADLLEAHWRTGIDEISEWLVEERGAGAERGRGRPPDGA